MLYNICLMVAIGAIIGILFKPICILLFLGYEFFDLYPVGIVAIIALPLLLNAFIEDKKSIKLNKN